MSKREPTLYLQDILTSLSRIGECIKNLSPKDLETDWKTTDAIIRNLEIIGEAAKNMPEELIEEYPDIPWSKMVSMRNKVIHEYFGVDQEILWKTITEDLPPLKQQIEDIIKNL